MAVPSPEAAEIIRRKMMQYGRFVDQKQWSKFHEIAFPDARLSYFNPGKVPMRVGKDVHVYDSLEKYTTHIGAGTANAQTSHLFGPGELVQVGPDEVEGIFSMQDRFVLNGTLALVRSYGCGFYFTTWRRKDGDWFLAELRLERHYVNSSICFLLILGLVELLYQLGLA